MSEKKHVVESLSGEIFTDLKDYVKSLIRGKMVNISVYDYEEMYHELNKAIYNLNPEKFNHYRMPTANKDYYELTPGASYMVRVGKYDFVKVNCSMESLSNATYKLVNLIIYGPNRAKIRQKMVNKIIRVRGEKINVNHFIRGYTNIGYQMDSRSIDSIILPQETKTRLISGLYGWWKSKDWYREHELVHKIGVLLYGKPGTGKSSLVRAIASMFGNAPIITLNCDDIDSGLVVLTNERRRTHGPMIVLFEDFDMFFYNRETSIAEEEDNDANLDVVTTAAPSQTMIKAQNTVFQILDGQFSTDDTIYIATTNHLNRIDPAMVRHGRFDIQEEIKYFTYEQTLEFVSMFGYDESFYKKHFSDLEIPVQPALLQARILEYNSTKMLERRMEDCARNKKGL